MEHIKCNTEYSTWLICSIEFYYFLQVIHYLLIYGDTPIKISQHNTNLHYSHGQQFHSENIEKGIKLYSDYCRILTGTLRALMKLSPD